MFRTRNYSILLLLFASFCVFSFVNATSHNQPAPPATPPAIHGFQPQKVGRGENLTILGTSLGEQVQFQPSQPTAPGQSPATARGTLAENDSTLMVKVPSSLIPGKYTLSVTTSAGTATSTDAVEVKSGELKEPVVYDDKHNEPITSLGDIIQNVFNYSFQVLGLIIFIMFVWAGFMWLMAGGNPGTIGKARSKMTSAILGGILLMSSYLILNTINPDLVNVQFKLPGISVEAPPPVGPAAVGDTQKAASELLNLIGAANFSTSGDCGPNFHALQNIRDMADGKFPAVCSYDCRSRQPVETRCPAGGPNGNVTVSPRLLEALAKLWRERSIRFTVVSLTTGAHSQRSSHYGGNAVDIVLADKSPQVWIEARGALIKYGASSQYTMCEIASGPNKGKSNQYCSLSGQDSVNHIHAVFGD